MTSIDAHIHVVPPRLPGVGPLSPLLNGPPEALASALRREMQAAGVTTALAMGCCPASDDDPLGVASTLRIAERVPGLYAIGVADPTRSDPAHLRRVEAARAGVARAFRYAERRNRFQYGTDWPLAPMAAYRDFVRTLVPAEFHDSVFAENARTLFRIG